ncbi:MAG: hypothetical protein VB092_01335 [Oscillospiraceae bacterium]|nr:hypothetical protein [Oscillospiraceae bacterium]
MDFFISLAAVLSISLFLTGRFKWNASTAPFFTLATVILFLCDCGLFGLLRPAVYVVYAFALYCLLDTLVLRRAALAETLRAFFQPGPVFFIGASIFFYFALRAKQPVFTYWDEFSFWGIAAKTIFENNTLYTLCESSMINVSYPPGLPVAGYFFQFLSGSFCEWKHYLAYDVLHMAAMTLLFSRIRWKNIIAALVTAFFSLASIYLFYISSEGMVFYCTSYSDWIVGILFAAVLLCWFSDESRGFPRYLTTMAAVMLLPYIKDIGLALGLIAAVIVSFDMLVSQNYPSEGFLRCEKKPVRVVYALLLFAALAISYFSWTTHFDLTQNISRIEIPYQYSFVEIITGKDPYFINIMKRMLDALDYMQLVSFGPMKDMIIVFFAIPIVGGLLTWDRKKFFRLCALSIELLCAFALYYVFQAYLYTAIFHHYDTYELTSYNRYISSYAIGWMYAAFGVLLMELASPRFKKLSLAPGVALCSLLLASHFYFTSVHPDQYVFTSPKIDISSGGVRQLLKDNAADFIRYMSPQDRIYFVCQESNGGEWFVFNYEFQPAYTVKTYGSGYFVPTDTADADMPDYGMRADRAGFSQYLIDEGVDYIYVLKIDDYFEQEFGGMFSDALRMYHDGAVHMYRVVNTQGSLSFIPATKGAAIPMLNEQYGTANED